MLIFVKGTPVPLNRLAQALTEAAAAPGGAELPVRGLFVEVEGSGDAACDVLHQHGLTCEPADIQKVNALLHPGVATPIGAALPSGLSDRDQRVMKLLIDGMSNKEIGYQLDIPEPTVKRSVQRIFARCGVRTRAQVVRAVLEHKFEGEAALSASHG